MVEIKKSYILTTQIVVGKPRPELFLFFGAAENLQLLTPSWLDFKILTPLPISMKQGTIIEYRLKLNGISLNWQTEIMVWDPPYRFVDTQRKGPYLSWIHEHCFEETDGNTLMIDRVEYRIPGSIIGDLLHAVLIRKQLIKIFTHRNQVIENIYNENKSSTSLIQ